MVSEWRELGEEGKEIGVINLMKKKKKVESRVRTTKDGSEVPANKPIASEKVNAGGHNNKGNL